MGYIIVHKYKYKHTSSWIGMTGAVDDVVECNQSGRIISIEI